MGPLRDVKVVELAGIGPGPFAAMLLADLGADVLRVERPGGGDLISAVADDPVRRGRPVLTADLKTPAGRETVLRLAQRADALIEGNRPGVLERLGLGPEVLHARAPQLVVGRMTGYGQDGPMAQVPGHDINYLGLSGALGAIARHGERPLFPLNLLGDYGGGGLLLAFGLVSAVLEARRSGLGQVVDAAMVEGAALLTTAIHGLRDAGRWSDEPGTNVLDSGAPFYEVYATADAKHVAVGAIEPQFYAALLDALELDPDECPQWDTAGWPALKERFAAVLCTRTRDEWTERLEHADACVTPVLGLGEAPAHPHNVARGTFVPDGRGALRPAPAPRFSRTPAQVAEPDDPAALLARWGVTR